MSESQDDKAVPAPLQAPGLWSRTKSFLRSRFGVGFTLYVVIFVITSIALLKAEYATGAAFTRAFIVGILGPLATPLVNILLQHLQDHRDATASLKSATGTVEAHLQHLDQLSEVAPAILAQTRTVNARLQTLEQQEAKIAASLGELRLAVRVADRLFSVLAQKGRNPDLVDLCLHYALDNLFRLPDWDESRFFELLREALRLSQCCEFIHHHDLSRLGSHLPAEDVAKDFYGTLRSVKDKELRRLIILKDEEKDQLLASPLAYETYQAVLAFWNTSGFVPSAVISDTELRRLIRLLKFQQHEAALRNVDFGDAVLFDRAVLLRFDRTEKYTEFDLLDGKAPLGSFAEQIFQNLAEPTKDHKVRFLEISEEFLDSRGLGRGRKP